MEEAKKELKSTRECAEDLIRKAANSPNANEAMSYSQAALNASKAVSELATLFGAQKD